MAPGRGGRGAPEETVVVDGKTLRRVLDEASKRWVYRPVDAASGETISKEDFEARRREEEAARRASDPRHRAAEEKRWLEQQRGDIREKRAEASRAMRREEHHAALRDGRVERRRPRRNLPTARTDILAKSWRIFDHKSQPCKKRETGFTTGLINLRLS